FPLPREFLFWRGLMSLLGALQEPIQARTSKHDPVVLFRGYGRTRVYIPHAWYTRFDLGNTNLEKYQLWEELFARKILVLGMKKTSPARVSKPPRVFTTVPKSNSAVIMVEEFVKNALAWMRKCIKN